MNTRVATPRFPARSPYVCLPRSADARSRGRSSAPLPAAVRKCPHAASLCASRQPSRNRTGRRGRTASVAAGRSGGRSPGRSRRDNRGSPANSRTPGTAGTAERPGPAADNRRSRCADRDRAARRRASGWSGPHLRPLDDLVEFAPVEPDAAAAGAVVDLHTLALGHLQDGLVGWTLHAPTVPVPMPGSRPPARRSRRPAAVRPGARRRRPRRG